MLTEICGHLHNWFPVKKVAGTFSVVSGQIDLSSFVVSGQYYRIIGSIFNDGVHKYGDNSDALTDEVFNGEVWSMAVPAALITLAGEIKTWLQNNGASAYTSESFGGYSYTRKDNDSWQGAFRSRLNQWRKL